MPKRRQSSSEQRERSSLPLEPGQDHRRLDVFLGKWATEGRQYDCPFGPALSIRAVQTYEWLPGGFFLVHRLDGKLGDRDMACIEITGWEASSRSYPTRTFYDDGSSSQWALREQAGVWMVTGDAQPTADALDVRCTLTFCASGHTLIGKWEYDEGAHWRTFWDVQSTKLGTH